MKVKNKKEKGITLIALVVTIVVLLILAGVSIAMLIGENGVINKAIESNEETAKAKAREKLEVVFAEATVPKNMDPVYNQNGYLDKMIKERIEDCSILKKDDLDIVIVEKWAFLIDRSIPKIVDEIGRKEDIVYPEISTDLLQAKDITAEYISNSVIVDYEEYTTTEYLKSEEIRNRNFNTWQILYADNNNIYLISQWGVKDEYNDSDYSKGIEILKDTTRFQAIEKGWHAPISNMNFTYDAEELEKALYRLDKQKWERYLGDMGEWALGGPTLEMFVASYDKVKGTNYRSKITVKDTGYEIPSELLLKDSIGYETVLNNGEHYNLACVSKSGEPVAFDILERNLGYGISWRAMGMYDGGSRVVVCLKSEAKLMQDKETGHYKVVK